MLFSASVASQLLSFGGLLVVARLYAPEQVGSLAVIVALGSVVSIVASGRFDLAAVTEPTDERATIYIKLVTGLTLLTAIVTMVGYAAASLAPFRERLSPSLASALWFLPAIVLCSGLNMAGLAVATRRRRYALLAANQVLIAAGTLAAQALFAGLLPASLALPAGFLAGQVCGLSVLVPVTRSDLFPLLVEDFWRKAWNAIRAARSFPLHAAPYSFVGQFYAQLPQLLISYFYGLAAGGQYSTAARVTLAPMIMLPTAIGQVVFGEMSRTPTDKQWGQRVALTTAVSGILMSVVLAAIVSAGPEIIVLLLGVKWATAGELAQQVGVASLCIALVAGYDRIFDVLGLQKLRLVLMIGNVAFLGVMLLALGYYEVSLSTFVVSGVVAQVLSALCWSVCAFRGSGFALKYLLAAWGITIAATGASYLFFWAISLPTLIQTLGHLVRSAIP